MRVREDPGGRVHAARSLDAALARIERRRNRELAVAYLQVRAAVEHRSIFTRANDAQALAGLDAQLQKTFDRATRADLMAWLDWIEAVYATSTQETMKSGARRFYKWLADPEGYLDARLRRRLEPMACAAWISFNRNWRDLPVDEVLTEEDVLALARAAQHARDRAFVLCLYESGARISEFLSLDVRHVQFDQHGARLLIRSGKTGGRRPRLIIAAEALREHLEQHPDPTPRAPLWYSLDSRPAYRHGRISRNSTRAILLPLARRAGIPKPAHPHAFRHARATVLAEFLTDAQQRVAMGWSRSSPMPGVYNHLSGNSVERALLERYGLVVHQRPWNSGKART